MQVTAKIWWTNVQQLGTQPYIANFTLSDASADMSGNGWMEVSTIAFDTPPIDDVKAFLGARLDAHEARVQAEADQALAEIEAEKQRVMQLEEPVPAAPLPEQDPPTDDA